MRLPTRAELQHLRDLLVPNRQLGWMPFYFLGYLAFLFLPSLFGNLGVHDTRGVPYGSIPATLATIVVFLPVYFLFYRSSGMRSVLCMLAIAALSIVLLPVNAFSNTYLIYAVAFAAFLDTGLSQRLTWAFLMLGIFLAAVILVGVPLFVFAITALISMSVFLANHFQIENARKREALKLSHEEVSRLAALAERERIGRDLHDLLGHTLSLVALKSELAGKLVGVDVEAARREIDEVTCVAREALSQVRRAVTGIRAAGLTAELAAARSLLESGGVNLALELEDVPLATEAETALALVLREAVTNILRHARARSASVRLEAAVGGVQLQIRDDGRGSAIAVGNGLRGMRERVESLGGNLLIDSVAGRGTRVSVTLPATTKALEGSVPAGSGVARPGPA